MKFNIQIVIFFCILFFGCSEKNGSVFIKGEIEYVDVSFANPVTYSLDSTKVNVTLYGVNKLMVTDQYLLTMSKRSDTIFRVFSLSNFKNICNFGNIGKGPQEFNTPIYSGSRSNGSNFVVTDLSSIKLISISRNDDSQFYPIVNQSYRLPGIFIPFNGAMVINDTLIMGVGDLRTTKELSWFNPKTGLTGSSFDFPELLKNVPQGVKAHLYSKVVDITPDKNRIVLAYTLFPCLKIIDLSKQTSTIIRVKTKYVQNSDPAFSNSTVSLMEMLTFYQNVVASAHYIVAYLYIKKFNGVIDNELQAQTLATPEIDFFSIDGKPLARILVEKWMRNFAIDEKNNRIIFYNDLNEDYLYTINLKSILPKQL